MNAYNGYTVNHNYFEKQNQGPNPDYVNYGKMTMQNEDQFFSDDHLKM